VVLLVVSWSRLDLVAQRFEVGSDVSLASRLKTWSDAVRIARDFPLFGTGLNTFDTAMVFYQSQPGGHWDAAHNDYVQLLADGGLLLCLPILVGVIALVREIARRLREERDDPEAYWLRAGAVLGLVAIGFQECLDFSLQLPGNAAMCAFLVAMAVRPTRGYNLGAVMS
jgi:O-antigen ligase